MKALAALLGLVAGCGGGVRTPAVSSGAVTVAFTPRPPVDGPLMLDDATLGLEDLSLFGDVQAAPGFMLPDVAVDALSPSPPLTMDGLQAGVYSRLRFSVESLQASGRWRDQALVVDLVDRDDDDDVVADLRLRDGQTLAAGGTVRLAVTIDVASWFAGVDLDAATVDADRCIRLGSGHNGALVPALLAALPPSFQLTAAP